jgi:hypothetical protein
MAVISPIAHQTFITDVRCKKLPPGLEGIIFSLHPYSAWSLENMKASFAEDVYSLTSPGKMSGILPIATGLSI